MAGGVRKNSDDRLALELAAGRTIAEAAASAGVSERTAYRRLEDAKFREHVTSFRSEMVNRASGRLADAATLAVDTLCELLGGASQTVRLGAARSILELGAKLRESTELERRIAELETRTNGQPRSSS